MISERGFSLLEVLCACTIGLLALAVSFELYCHVRQSHRLGSALADIAENGRFASYILRRTIRQAGLIGDIRLTGTFPVINMGVSEEEVMAYNQDIDVFRGRKYPALHITPKEGSAVILVRYMSPIANRVVDLKGNRLIIHEKPAFREGEDIVISDRSHAVLAHVLSVSFHTPFQYLTLSQKIEPSFHENAEVGKLKVIAFFIGETNRQNRWGHKIYALYQCDEGNRKTELVPNVIDLRVRCFEKVNGLFRVKSSNEVSAWSQVVALQIDLLLRSNDPVLSLPKPYQFREQVFYPYDRYLYYPIQITVLLREHEICA